MKRKKRIIIITAMIAVIMIAVAAVTQSSNWSNLSFEAVVQETVTMPDGEMRVIVERTTEIHANPLNSLHIGEETKILDTDGQTISFEALQLGNKVQITLKDAFTEETPFYYPTVYEIKINENVA